MSGDGRGWTPGPWVVVTPGIGGCVAIVAASKPNENLLGIFSDAENDGLAVFTHGPNGVLSAAAPDLFDALERMLASHEPGCPFCPDCEVGRVARAALAKAGGEG